MNKKRKIKGFEIEPDVELLFDKFDINSSKQINVILRMALTRYKQNQMLEVILESIKISNKEFYKTIEMLIKDNKL